MNTRKEMNKLTPETMELISGMLIVILCQVQLILPGYILKVSILHSPADCMIHKRISSAAINASGSPFTPS